MGVEGWLARAALARPDRIALQTPGGDWSYARLHAAARFAAGELRARGAGPGARVAIALPAGADFAQALHACLLLGAVAVPIDLRLSAQERELLADGAAVLVEEPLGEGPAPASVPARCEHDLDASAVVIHTSGTTAAPRPIELTYGNFLWSALGSAVALGVDPDERWLCALPLSHVGGLSILLRSTIYATTAVVHPSFDAERVVRALREHDVTLVSLVATTLSRVLDAGLQRPPALRCALTGGGPVPAALVQRAHDAGVPVGLTYGLSESCSQVTTTPVAEIEDASTDNVSGADRGVRDVPGVAPGAGGVARAGPGAGPSLFCTNVRIAADEEILVRGPTVAPGSLSADGWLHTGDLGALDDRGRLSVSGRKADTIISGGENVAPAEIEAVLEAHPQVLEAAVLGRPDEQWGEAVAAIVCARPGETVDLESLRAHCAETLAPYKVPKRFELSSEPLPRTRSGKLLRRELR